MLFPSAVSQVDRTPGKQWGTEHIGDGAAQRCPSGLDLLLLPPHGRTVHAGYRRDLLPHGNLSHDPPFLSFLRPLVPDGYGTASPLVTATFLAQQDTGWE